MGFSKYAKVNDGSKSMEDRNANEACCCKDFTLRNEIGYLKVDGGKLKVYIMKLQSKHERHTQINQEWR